MRTARKLGCVSSGAVLALTQLRAKPADAFPISTYSCNSGLTPQNFNNSPDSRWTTASPDGGTLLDSAISGISLWNSAEDADGNGYVTLAYTPNQTLGVELIEWFGLGQGVDASTECGGATIIDFNSDIISTDFAAKSGYMKSTAMHEYGHVLQLTHTGEFDSADGYVPVEVTHLDYPSGYPTNLAQDDVEQIGAYWTRSTPKHPMVANVGFEQQLTYWGLTGGGTAKTFNSGGYSNTKYVALATPNINTDSLYQTANAAQTKGHSVTVYGRFAAEKTASTDSGNILVQVLMYQVMYTGTSDNYGDCTHDYVTQKCQNNRSPAIGYGSWSTCSSVKQPVTSTWAVYNTSGNCTIPTTWTGADIRIRAISGMQNSGGAATYVNIDSVRPIFTLN